MLSPTMEESSLTHGHKIKMVCIIRIIYADISQYFQMMSLKESLIMSSKNAQVWVSLNNLDVFSLMENMTI